MAPRHPAQKPRARVKAVASGAALIAGLFAWAAPSGADVAEVSGGAFGQQVSVSVAGGTPVASGPAPAVVAAATGGSARDAAPSSAVGAADPTGPFGGAYLRTGLLTVTAWGRTGRAGSVTTSATAGAVDALGGALAVSGVSAACVADAAGPKGTVTVTGGRLAVSPTETVDLPPDPAPGTTLTATTGSGERLTVVLNEQQVVDGTLVVNAVRLVLDGPAASGQIVVASARCGVTAAAPAPAPETPPTTAVTTPAEPAADAGATAPVGAPETSAPALQPASTEPAGTATTTGPPPADPSVGVRAAAGALQAVTVSSVTGGAFGAYAKVSLFGGTPLTVDARPTVTLPAAGSASPVTASAPSGLIEVGPARLFMWDAMTLRTEGTTGLNGSVISAVNITGSTDSPPGPVLADRFTSTCTATATGVTGSATLTNGKIETKYELDRSKANWGEAIAWDPLPASPAPNTERTGKLEHIGDSYRVVLNEQVRGADGSLTVNAFHLYMLGPTGVGDVIVGQSRCGVATVAAESTNSTSAPAASTAAGTTTGAAGGTGEGAASVASAASGSTGSTAGTGAAAGSAASRSSGGTAVAGASQSRGGAAGAALATTGGTVPRLLSVALLGAALAVARLRRVQGEEPPAEA